MMGFRSVLVALGLLLCGAAEGSPKPRLVKTIALNDRYVQLAFSRDGALLGVLTGNGFSIFRTADWRRVLVEHIDEEYLCPAPTGLPFLVNASPGKSELSKYAVAPPANFLGDDMIFTEDPTGRILVVSGLQDIRAYDLKTGATLPRYSLDQDKYGGDLLPVWKGFAGGYGYANYYPSQAINHPVRLKGRTDPWCFAYAPKPHLLFGGTGEGKVYAWSGPESTPKLICVPHRQLLLSIAVPSDGSLVALAYQINYKRPKRGDWNRFLLVDTKSGRTLLSVRSAEEVDSVAFSPDGRFVAVGERDGTLRIYNCKQKPL